MFTATGDDKLTNIQFSENAQRPLSNDYTIYMSLGLQSCTQYMSSHTIDELTESMLVMVWMKFSIIFR